MRYGVRVKWSVSRKRDLTAIRQIDEAIHGAISAAVLRVDRWPDTGALLGQPTLVRVMEYDAVSYPGGFTRGEAHRIAQAARDASARACIRRVRR